MIISAFLDELCLESVHQANQAAHSGVKQVSGFDPQQTMHFTKLSRWVHLLDPTSQEAEKSDLRNTSSLGLHLLDQPLMLK